MGNAGRAERLKVTIAGLAVLIVFATAAVISGPGAADDQASAPRAEPDPRLEDPSVYPTRGFHDIKGVSPEGYGPEQLPGVGTTAVNMAWDIWEPTVELPPCAANRVEYDGRCFVVPAQFEREVQEFSEAGVHVTGIFWGTPTWARGQRPCVPFLPWLDRFCVPDNPEDFARFVGFIADRYDGTNGVGRIVDFVIQNEVNTSMWFNTGCGSGVPCDLDSWVADYAALYNPSYDRIRAAQPQARVLFSFTNLFAAELDEPGGAYPSYSIQTFLPRLTPLVGEREWSIAHHPYPTNLDARIDVRDYPYATLGSVGVLSGWLHATYPDDPHAWEVQLTEQGFHATPENAAAVSTALCDSFRNVLGTPGITSYVYHRRQDVAGEQGLLLGLFDLEGNPKPVWSVWRDANDPDDPSCGFELDGHTLVRQAVHPTSGAHWFTSRTLPAGYTARPGGWELSWSQQPGTRLLFECANDAVDASWLWDDAGCDGGIPMGPVGWIATGPGGARAALRSCTGPGRYGRTTTTAASCPAGQTERILGYVVPGIEEPPTSTTSSTTTSTTEPGGPGPREDDLLLRLDSARGAAGTTLTGTVDLERVATYCADTVPEVQENFRLFRQAVEDLAAEFGGVGQLLPPYQDQTHAAFNMLWTLGVGIGSDRGYAELALAQTHVLTFVEDIGDLTMLAPLGELGGFDPATGRAQVEVPDLAPGDWPTLAACVSPRTEPAAIRGAVAAGVEFLDSIDFDPSTAQGAEFLTFLQEIAPDLLMPVVEVDAWSEQSFCIEAPDDPCTTVPPTSTTTPSTTPPSSVPQVPSAPPPPATPVPGRPQFTG